VQETRRDYEDICTSIHQNFNLDIRLVWCNSTICFPQFTDNPMPKQTDNRFPRSGVQEDVDSAENEKNEDNSKSSCSLSDDDDDCSVNFISIAECKSNVHSVKKQSKSCGKNLVGRSSERSDQIRKSFHSFPTNISNEKKGKDSLFGEVNELNPVCPEVSTRSSVTSKINQNSNHGDCQDDFNFLNGDSVEMDPLEFVETSSRTLESNGFVSEGAENDSWMTLKSSGVSHDLGVGLDTKSEADLEKMKENLSLELLWIGQAIISRKSYLKMKNGLR